MENMNPESLFRKAQALGDDIREMESIDTLAAYHKAKFDINKIERKIFILLKYILIGLQKYYKTEQNGKNVIFLTICSEVLILSMRSFLAREILFKNDR